MASPHLRAVPDEFNFERDDEPQIVERPQHTWRFQTRDENGHREQVNLKFPENYMPRIMKVVNNDATPFNTAQDFIRNAMYHYLLFMDDWLQDPELSEMMKLTQQRAKVDARRAEILNRTELIQTAIQAIEEAVAAKDWDDVRDAISDGQEIVDTSRVDATPLAEAIRKAQGELNNHA